jgi:hypothetical protein
MTVTIPGFNDSTSRAVDPAVGGVKSAAVLCAVLRWPAGEGRRRLVGVKGPRFARPPLRGATPLTPPGATAGEFLQATYGLRKGTSMSRFTPRHRRHPSFAALSALDFGLRVRIETNADQRSIFHGSESLSVQELTSELSEMLSGLRVRSFALRAQIEQVTSALMVNVDCGFWPLARRAALDLGGLLASAGKRRFADPELCVRGANCAFRIADLISQAVR